MKITFTLLFGLCLFSSVCYCQQKATKTSDDKKIDSLIIALQGLHFHHDIEDAKTGLVNYQKLNTDPDDLYTQLATSNFEGQYKGIIIPYNFDWLSIRAGYVIEELTFIDFGYSSKMKMKDLGNGFYKATLDKIVTSASFEKDRKIMADNVANWWKMNGSTWTRFGALKTALQSKNKVIMVKAIEYIYDGETKCDGFAKEAFEKELKPLLEVLLIKALKDVKDRMEMNEVELLLMA